MNKKGFTVGLLGLSVVFLVSCGEEKSQPLPSPQPQPQPQPQPKAEQTLTGSFGGGLLSGIAYQSGDLTGTIDGEGQFQYREGEDITFSIGNIPLATAKASDAQTWLLSAHEVQLTENHGALNLILTDTIVTGYDVLANKLAFLSALDDDQESNNGLVAGSWSDQLTAETVNFELPYLQFISTELLAFQQRHSLPETTSLHGLQGLYNALSVPLYDYYEKSKTLTKQADTGSYIRYYDFALNEKGQTTREFRQNDTLADGTIDSTETREYSYTAEGWQTAYTASIDNNADGIEDRRYEYDYGWTATNKRLFSESRDDYDGDSNFETVTRLDWQYTEFDKVAEQRTVTSRYSSDAVAVTSTTLSYFYNELQQLEETISITDQATDGSIDSETKTSYEYDENGNQTLRSTVVDSDYDKVPNQIYEVLEQYNSNNQIKLRRFENDFDGDGAIDNVQEFRFNYADGKIIESETFRDGNNDGVLDWYWIREYEYDSDGALTKRIDKYDSDMNGIYETIFANSFTETLDAKGAVVETVESTDTFDDGTIDAQTIVSTDYDPHNGLVTRMDNRRDYNMDGDTDRQLTLSYTFNEQLNVETLTIVTVEEQTQTETKEYVYEAIPTTLKIKAGRRPIQER